MTIHTPIAMKKVGMDAPSTVRRRTKYRKAQDSHVQQPHRAVFDLQSVAPGQYHHANSNDHAQRTNLPTGWGLVATTSIHMKALQNNRRLQKAWAGSPYLLFSRYTKNMPLLPRHRNKSEQTQEHKCRNNARRCEHRNIRDSCQLFSCKCIHERPGNNAE